MAVKLYKAGTGDTGNQAVQTIYWFHCPGCECGHAFHVPQWTWNGSMDSPSFQPSLMCNRDDPRSQCHSFITDGKIQFLSDCWHGLAGQTVDIPDWDGLF